MQPTVGGPLPVSDLMSSARPSRGLADRTSCLPILHEYLPACLSAWYYLPALLQCRYSHQTATAPATLGGRLGTEGRAVTRRQTRLRSARLPFISGGDYEYYFLASIARRCLRQSQTDPEGGRRGGPITHGISGPACTHDSRPRGAYADGDLLAFPLFFSLVRCTRRCRWWW